LKKNLNRGKKKVRDFLKLSLREDEYLLSAGTGLTGKPTYYNFFDLFVSSKKLCPVRINSA
jgi:hypothetical protein